MATDTSKITGAADDLSDKLTKGGSAAKTLGAEIANAFKSLDDRVTAIEAGGGSGTQPPIEPIEPPPSNAKGKISNFKPNDSDLWQIDSKDWCNQNANKSHCLKQLDEYTVRFEDRSGDVWQHDSASNNRNEASASWGDLSNGITVADGVPATLDMTVTIEPGPKSTSSFCSLCQFHATTNNPPSPFYLQLAKDDYLHVVLQKPKGTGSENIYVYISPQPITRGRAMHFRAEVMMKAAGGGYARVWLDDVQIANYNGAIGANNSRYYWKFGLYRVEVPETLSAVFRNVSLTSG